MPEPHRQIHVGTKGDDVTALQGATDRRLKARGQYDYLVGDHDGDAGPKTFRGVRRAAFLLGASTRTVEDLRNLHPITVGVQRMIEHPGRRSERQLHDAAQRMAHASRQKAHEAAVSHGIGLATAAARLALAHAPEVHYTQDARRWEGIEKGLHASRGQFPHYADCSAFYTWCLWQTLGDGPDVVNGADWKGGYTGTLLTHGRPVGEGHVGAAVLYGRRGTTGEHVAYNLGNGTVISHGSEGGPYLLPMRYRSDLMAIRAYD